MLDTKSAFPGWWAVLPVAGAALLLSAPAAWFCRALLASPPLVWIGLISYPLYLWHWPLLVFSAIIKFGPLTLLERELIVASFALAWPTYRFVEIPFRFGRPSPLKISSLCSGMVLVAVAGAVVVVRDAASTSGCRRKFAPWPMCRRRSASGGSMNACSISAMKPRSPNLRRPRSPAAGTGLGDSTAGALLPGLRKAQERETSASRSLPPVPAFPALNADIAGHPTAARSTTRFCRWPGRSGPKSCCCTEPGNRYLDSVAETVAALKKQTSARVIVLGAVPGGSAGFQTRCCAISCCIIG